MESWFQDRACSVCFLHWKLSEEGSLSFLSGSCQPRNWTWVSCITGGFFTSWFTMEDHMPVYVCVNIQYLVLFSGSFHCMTDCPSTYLQRTRLHSFNRYMLLHCKYAELFLIHFSVDGLLGWFHVLVICKWGCNEHECAYVFLNNGSLSNPSGIAAWYGSSIFSFLRNLHTALHSGYIRLHSNQSARGVSFLYILSSIVCRFLMMVIVTDVK